MRIKRKIIRLHRWLGIGAAIFWLCQAITGLVLVFHWEIDDALLPGPHNAPDWASIEAVTERLAPAGSETSISSIWTSASGSDRFDIYLDGPQGSSTIRIDGEGTILREQADGERIANGSWIGTLVSVHHNFLAGDLGSWIVGVSGILLISNLGLGIVQAWPRGRNWRRALLPQRTGPKAAQRYAWHRAIGFWGAIPALFSVAAGTLLAFESGTAQLLGVPPLETPLAYSDSQGSVGMAAATQIALAAFPDSQVSGISFPSEEAPIYEIRLLQRDEPRRAYGKTRVYVNAANGSILKRYDATTAPLNNRIMDSLFAFHTGEFGGFLGRFAVFSIGLWLIVMIILGLSLWLVRRDPRRP
jgi:uncharacterized iron-regulated membrane protein